MAAAQRPRPGPPTPSSSSNSSTPTPDAQPKLRNSCHPCATSKLKCTKEKPTCGRCAKRGITCEYVAAKRGSRRPNNSQSSVSESNTVPNVNNSNNSHVASQPSWLAPSSSMSGCDPSRQGSWDMMQDFFSPMDQASIAGDTDADLDEFLRFSLQDMSDANNLMGQADFFSMGLDNGGGCNSNGLDGLSDTYPAFEDAVTELLALPSPCATPPREMQYNAGQQDACATSDCSCLAQALVLMKQLFPPPTNACMTRAEQGLDKATSIPTIQTVLGQNETTIDAVSTMLKCPCSQDGYLLAVMGLIIFKVIGWYAAAARQTPSLQQQPQQQQRRPRQGSHPEQVLLNPAVVGGYTLEGEGSSRMAAQLVLSELHRVRRLVEQLSAKLKLQAAKKGDDAGGAGAKTAESLGEMTLPLSAVIYDQLDVDLRRRLKALSSEILERLRRL